MAVAMNFSNDVSCDSQSGGKQLSNAAVWRTFDAERTTLIEAITQSGKACQSVE